MSNHNPSLADLAAFFDSSPVVQIDNVKVLALSLPDVGPLNVDLQGYTATVEFTMPIRDLFTKFMEMRANPDSPDTIVVTQTVENKNGGQDASRID